MRFALLPFAIGLVLSFTGCAAIQRSLLFHPTHDRPEKGLAEWKRDDQIIGFAHSVPQPRAVWLMLHGNGGQAAYRAYALRCFSPDEAVYILEYPGYGQRPGVPSTQTLNDAARKGYRLLREQFPGTPVCVAGESIGTGPASHLATEPQPPDKIVLVVPFAVLQDVVRDHVSFLPSGLLVRNSWNNVEALKDYHGPLEIFAAKGDTIIPVRHARALAAAIPKAALHEFEGGHNDWPNGDRVKFRYP